MTRTVADEFVDALTAQDFDRLSECFAPDVEFHAVVPATGSFREQTGADETADQFRRWFGDADPFELLESSITPIVDKVRLSYRLAACEEGKWHVVEQQAYATIGEGGIEKLDLACSGFRPVDVDPRPS